MQPLNDENQYSAKLYNALKKQTCTDITSAVSIGLWIKNLFVFMWRTENKFSRRYKAEEYFQIRSPMIGDGQQTENPQVSRKKITDIWSLGFGRYCCNTE